MRYTENLEHRAFLQKTNLFLQEIHKPTELFDPPIFGLGEQFDPLPNSRSVSNGLHPIFLHPLTELEFLLFTKTIARSFPISLAI